MHPMDIQTYANELYDSGENLGLISETLLEMGFAPYLVKIQIKRLQKKEQAIKLKRLLTVLIATGVIALIGVISLILYLLG